MKAKELSILKSQDQSFTFYHELKPFSPWHYHPEFELVLITKGKGKRMVGDSIESFEDGDLMLLGSNLPHEWLCTEEYYADNSWHGEGIVIQFLKESFGEGFFMLNENKKLNRLLEISSRGCLFFGESKKEISKIMEEMLHKSIEDQLYDIFRIFRILNATEQYELLSSPAFISQFVAEENKTVRKVIDFTMQNFQRKIQVKEILDQVNMSNTAFTVMFRKTFRMSYSEYLQKVRIGYACNLLTDSQKSINTIAFDAGFENLSNFNRLFKKAKNLTPKEFRKKANESQNAIA
jgi:AraC-like DNA-binding protein